MYASLPTAFNSLWDKDLFFAGFIELMRKLSFMD